MARGLEFVVLVYALGKKHTLVECTDVRAEALISKHGNQLLSLKLQLYM